MTIQPNRDQFRAYAESDHDGEVVMVNLLKFKDRAEGNDDDDGLSGSDAYKRYSDEVIGMVERQGGRLLWLGRADHVFIGDVDANEWDSIALVSYPSRQAFLDMVSTPQYRDAHQHREAGLEDTVIIACTPLATVLDTALGEAARS
jgi:uncharacterized protein (DUF1330 family)